MTRLETLTQDPFFVGIDRIFDRMHTLNRTNANQNSYPPYNLIKTDENHYVVELAVAGFKQEDLDITVEDGVLSIEGKIADKEETLAYLHRGISARAFKRVFTLADTVVVRSADLSDGMLRVELENVIPEEKKPRKIEIGYNSKPALEHDQPELLVE